jgi:hypothetical protein
MRECCVAMVLLSVPMGQSALSAQVLAPPARPEPSPSPGDPPPQPEEARSRQRSRQELTLEGNVLGGYDDNLSTPGGQPLTSHPSGYTGFGDEMLRYWVGRDAQSMEVSGRAFMNTYRNAGVTPSYGGEKRLTVRTPLGRRTHVEVEQGLRYSPYFSLGLFGAPQGSAGADNPDRNPTNALTESRSWTTDASAYLTRQWTRATKMDLDYSFSKQTYVNGVAFDSRTHAGSLAFEQSISRTLGIRLAYHRTDSRFVPRDGGAIPNLSQTADVGFHYQHRLSRTRQLSFSAGAGAMSVATVEPSTRAPVRLWAPSGYGTLSINVGRSWNIGADYRRSTSVPQGIAPQPFIDHVGTVNAGGLLQPWLETVFTAGYSNGMAGQPTSDRARPGSYDGYTGTIQLRFKLTHWWSSVVSLNHSQNRLNTEASRSLGVPPDTHRNALRVGFTWQLPLYASSIARTKPPLRGPED